MSTMSDLDLRLREAGINPGNMELEEAIDLLRTLEVREALNQDCECCEVPEEGMIHYESCGYVDYGYYVVYCNHRCRLDMPEYIAAETLGLEETEETGG